MTALSPTDRSTVRRSKERARSDRADLYAVLDAGLFCHLAFTSADAPIVLPTGYGRIDDTLYLHGSTGAQSLRTAAGGSAVCVAVTLVDGIVYARSAFHHSANYRSAVIHGTAVPVTDDEAKLTALHAITEHLAPGSWSYARLPNARELAATAVLAVDLTESSVKVRTGPPVDDEADLTSPTWAGVLPLTTSWGKPRSCELLADGTPVPRHVVGRAPRA